MKKGIIGAVALAVVLIFGLIGAIVCLERIPAGYVGVVYNMNGGVDGEVLIIWIGLHTSEPWSAALRWTWQARRPKPLKGCVNSWRRS